MKTKEEKVWVKDGEKKEKEKEAQVCRNPGLNQGPLDLQSNALPTELFRPTRGPKSKAVQGLEAPNYFTT